MENSNLKQECIYGEPNLKQECIYGEPNLKQECVYTGVHLKQVWNVWFQSNSGEMTSVLAL